MTLGGLYIQCFLEGECALAFMTCENSLLVEELEMSRSPEAKEQIHVLFLSLLPEQRLHLPTLPS